MTERIVKTKKELKEAIKDNVELILVARELEKDIRPIVKIMKMSPKKRNAIIGFLGAGGATVVASVAAAPATAGISSIAGAFAVISFAASSGVSIPILVALILLCVAIGISSVVLLLRTYDVTEDEIEFEGYGVRFRRKTAYNTGKKS